MISLKALVSFTKTAAAKTRMKGVIALINFFIPSSFG